MVHHIVAEAMVVVVVVEADAGQEVEAHVDEEEARAQNPHLEKNPVHAQDRLVEPVEMRETLLVVAVLSTLAVVTEMDLRKKAETKIDQHQDHARDHVQSLVLQPHSVIIMFNAQLAEVLHLNKIIFSLAVRKLAILLF